MGAIKAGGLLKWITLGSSERLRRTHICNVFVLQAKDPIRTPFCLWAAVCLRAERAAGPFTVCVHNSHSVHTLTHMLLLSPHSAPCFMPLCTFQSYVLPVFMLLFVCLFPLHCGTLCALFSGLWHYAKLPEKDC